MTPRMAVIAAVARNGVIGNKGKIPWRLPSDQQFFKRVTMGKPIIMGRKTFESLGKALPGRANVVISRDPDFAPPGAHPVLHFAAATKLARQLAHDSGVDEFLVIGGGEIYQRAIREAERLYITHVAADPEGDTHFPPIDPGRWTSWPATGIERSEKDNADYEIRVYERL